MVTGGASAGSCNSATDKAISEQEPVVSISGRISIGIAISQTAG
jgi:hypothetical protein